MQSLAIPLAVLALALADGPRARTVVVKGTAPAGSQVTLGGTPAAMSPDGHWSSAVSPDSAAGPGARRNLCLIAGGDTACVALALDSGSADTLELSPLAAPAASGAADGTGPAGGPGAAAADAAGPAGSAGAGTAPIVDEGAPAAARTVKVRARRKPVRAAGRTRVSAAEIKRMPGLAEPDVIRAVQALPGVVASSDFSTKLYVRGSGSDQNLVLFDNAALYSPMHFGGIFSTFLADAIGGVDFRKGGFPARYGGRLSSVLSVDSKTGGTADTGAARETWAQGNARVTTLSGSLETDGRKGNWSWVAAGRRTWIDQAVEAARAAGLTDLDLPYYFYDAQGSVAYGRGGDTLRVSAYRGYDELALDPVSIDWGNFAVPVNLKLKLGDRWGYAGSFAYSRFSQHWAFSDIMRLRGNIEDWNARQEASFDAGRGHLLTLGGEYDHFRAVLGQQMPIYDLDQRDDAEADLYAAYLADRWLISPRHTLEAGLRAYRYPEKEGLAFDPRATFTWRPAKDWRLDLHAGLYTQYLTSIRWTDQETFNEYWYPAKGTIEPSRASLISAGIERSDLTPLKLRVSLEGYYKDIGDLPVYFPNRTQGESRDADSARGGFSLDRDFTAQDGYALGGELTVARDEGALSGEASWGVSQAVLRQRDYANALGVRSFDAYPADWDQRHTFKARLDLNWRGKDGSAFWGTGKHGRYLRTSLQANYHTGLPYTAFQDVYRVHEPDQGSDGGDGSGPPAGLDDNQYLRQGRRNGETRDAYFRLDATVIDWGREGKWRLYWTLLNITDRKNVFLVNYDTSKNPPERKESYQIPFLPILAGYEYAF